MRAFLLVVMAGTMLLAMPAMGLVAGVYFDSDGTINCATDVWPGEYGPGFVYVIVTDPHVSCQQYGFGGWEGKLEIAGPLTVLDWGMPAGAVNIDVPPVFYVGFSSPRPFSTVAVLLDMTVAITGPEPISFRLMPAPVPSMLGPYPIGVCPCDVCEPEFLLCPTGLDEHGEPNVCATINGPCVVAGDVATWGAVKAIYR